MRKPVLSAAALVIVLAATTACGSGSDQKNDQPKNATTATAGVPTEPTAKELTAGDAFKALSDKVASAKLSGVVTEDNDPNHLLGRPHQYTSKVTFTDARIKVDDVADAEPGSVGLGGAIEVFTTTADAQARADYIQNVTKGMPVLAEYDFVSGTALIRVSHYLTPTQAADYKTAAATLG
ncbi:MULTISPECIES: hypothetical protein [unclassified Streptomyces]|uniref:hypothetical protein n=1 Tax=unclassified Streptomyces TaxID=2593676 RepID=UPI0006FEEC92|nr:MULTISPECIES: hypothetical protein [unclassified Streptomyces]KQX47255.1 hypothetical protein ASD33_20760 [Streptomyces sp. Root1304]KRA94562.1 hypothetical protein ASE09_29975 [Streptomyces sp. Root66D1]